MLGLIIGALLGGLALKSQKDQQKKAIKQERDALDKSQRAAQEAQRDALRRTSTSRGTGDFTRPTSGAFGGALKQITGA